MLPNLTADKAAKITKKSTYRQHDWRIVNTSPCGYCLCTTADYPEDIHVGGIIGLRTEDEDAEHYSHIGTIRWIQFTKSDELQIGIQLISQNAIAVAIQSQQQRLERGDYLRGLVLPAHTGVQEEQTIVVPKVPYKIDDHIHMLNEHIDSDIKLTECVNHNLYYNQFKFELLKNFGELLMFPKQE